MPRSLLPLRVELLGIIGNTLLSEQARSRELEATSLRLRRRPRPRIAFSPCSPTSSVPRSPRSWVTTFTVSLPALVDCVEPAVGPAPLSGPASSLLTDPALRGLRVLVVDDDPDARDLFTRVLEQCDARVAAVATVPAALAALEHWKPDVLVSDIGMPGENGYVLMRTIRRLAPERGGKIPALAVTAYAGAEDVKLALSAGFHAHRAKPIEPGELALAVGELARGAR